MDSVWIWFAENGNIRKWQSTPFQDGVEYRRAPAQAAVQALDELRRKIQAIPRTDRGFSWEQSNSRNIEELRAYGPIAAMCKFILDNTDAILSALVSAPADPAPAPADVVEENTRLRNVISKVCAALPNGAYCSPTASIEFMEYVPGEVTSVIASLRAAPAGDVETPIACAGEPRWGAYWYGSESNKGANIWTLDNYGRRSDLILHIGSEVEHLDLARAICTLHNQRTALSAQGWRTDMENAPEVST